MNSLEPHLRAWSLFWATLLGVPFVVGLTAEIIALCTNWRNTLSAQVWRPIAMKQGQDIPDWTAGHVLALGHMARNHGVTHRAFLPRLVALLIPIN